jgi:hypothetical protein
VDSWDAQRSAEGDLDWRRLTIVAGKTPSTFYEYGGEAEDEEPPRDEKVDEAREELRTLFREHSDRVFYHRLICVLFERRFFHWITGKALKELAAEGFIGAATVALKDMERPLHFFFPRKLRYWKRQAGEVAKLVERFSTNEFGRALGHHGELLIDAALSAKGFTVEGKQVTEFNGRSWRKTKHNLDRVYKRDGCHYGCEIKNTLDYMPRDEMELKVEMCSALDLTPLFVVRMAPAPYIEFVREAGGYTLVVEYQLYPFASEQFAREVRAGLGVDGEMVRNDGKTVPFRFPVDSPAALYDGTAQRVLNWHLGRLPRE